MYELRLKKYKNVVFLQEFPICVMVYFVWVKGVAEKDGCGRKIGTGIA